MEDKNTVITKEIKIKLLKTLKKEVITEKDKEELCKLLELPIIQIEVIDKREQVRV